MENKQEFPTIVNVSRFNYLKYKASNYVERFEKLVMPVLKRFGLSDDEHIRKYLGLKTMEPIYRDFVKERSERCSYLEIDAEYSNEDVWAPIRSIHCKIRSPKEKGFVFAPIHVIEDDKELVMSSLSVQDGVFFIDDALLEDASIIHPTENQRFLYDLVVNFCKELEEMNLDKNYVQSLLYNSPKNGGRIRPNIHGILHRQYSWLREKK